MEFAMVSVNVLDNEDLSRLEKLAYVFLCKFMNRESCKCFPSYATLAKNLDCTRRTAIRVIKNLIKVGILDKEYRFDEEGDNRSNSYTLLPELQRKIKYKKTSKTITQEKIEIEEEKTQEKIEIEEEKTQEKIEIEEEKTQEKIEIEEEKLVAINEVREFISEPLADKEIKALLKAADGNINKIKEKYEIAKSQSCNNLVGFLIKAIKNNYQPNKSIKKKNKFVNYTERKIDPKRLEEIGQKRLARKLEEIDEKIKKSSESEKNNLRVYTQNELHGKLVDYSNWVCYGGEHRFTDFSNSDISGLDLSCKYLKGINFSNSNLSGASLAASKFMEANFKGSNLRGADLEQGNFSGANFSGANLTGIIYDKANFTGADFTGAKVDEDFLEYIKKNE